MTSRSGARVDPADNDGTADALQATVVAQGTVTDAPEPLAGEPAIAALAAAEPRAGRMIGPYRLVEKVGEGGMGAVWKAVHSKLEKRVALKLLPARLLARPEVVARFQREMRAAGRVEHPNVVTAFDAGEADGVHFLAMELVDGPDLLRLVEKRGPLSVQQACRAVRQAALGLAAAHGQGLVHRDVKPQNLLVSKEGKVKLLDLGLARLAEEAADAATAAGLTAAGQVMGTPDYMAPEQWEDTHAAGPSADLYALGCTLYFLLTGKAPFTGHTSFARKMQAHLTEAAPSLRAARPEVPAELDALCGRLLAKRPEDRLASADALAAALAPLTGSSPGSAKEAAEPAFPVFFDEPISAHVAGARTSAGRAAPPGGRKRWLLAAAGGLFGLGLLGVVFVLTLDLGDATLTVKSFDPDVKVSVRKGGKEVAVLDEKTNASAELDPGTYTLALKKGSGGELSAKLSPDRVTLSRGDAVVVEVTKVEKATPAVDPRVALAESDPRRAAALWVLEQGGWIQVKVEGQKRTVKKAIELPSGPFAADMVTDLHLADLPFNAGWLDPLRPLQPSGLNLIGTPVKDEDLAAVRETFPGLRGLHLYKTGISDAGLRHLRGWATLDYLDLNMTEVSDTGVASLEGLSLGRLILSNTGVTNEGVATIRRLAPGLTALVLNGTGVTDAGVKHLAGLEKLEELVLFRTGITDTAFDTLRTLPRLRSVEVNDTKVTVEGVEAFRAERPGCKVIWQAGGRDAGAR